MNTNNFQGKQWRRKKLKTDDIDDAGEGESRHTRRRKKNLPSPVKTNAETLDNRYTDVVSLQCQSNDSEKMINDK